MTKDKPICSDIGGVVRHVIDETMYWDGDYTAG